MGLFVESEGDVAILSENGVYKQVPVFTRNGYMFAKLGAGFVRLNADGSTSKATARLDTLDLASGATLGADIMGRLCDPMVVQGAKPLAEPSKQKLLGVLE